MSLFSDLFHSERLVLRFYFILSWHRRKTSGWTTELYVIPAHKNERQLRFTRRYNAFNINVDTVAVNRGTWFL